jgi:general secretion pathway protein F
MSNYGLLVVALFVVLFLLFKYFYKQNKEFALKFDEYILKLNIIGPIIKYSALFRFSLVFSELIKAGLPVVEAINVASDGVENSYLSIRLKTIAYNIKKGLSLSAAFTEAKVFESMIVQIVGAGESSGTLSLMLSKATEYYRAQFQMRMDGISSSLEPILIVIMSCAVLILALGIFMPMWELAGAVKG